MCKDYRKPECKTCKDSVLIGSNTYCSIMGIKINNRVELDNGTIVRLDDIKACKMYQRRGV